MRSVRFSKATAPIFLMVVGGVKCAARYPGMTITPRALLSISKQNVSIAGFVYIAQRMPPDSSVMSKA